MYAFNAITSPFYRALAVSHKFYVVLLFSFNSMFLFVVVVIVFQIPLDIFLIHGLCTSVLYSWGSFPQRLLAFLVAGFSST